MTGKTGMMWRNAHALLEIAFATVKPATVSYDAIFNSRRNRSESVSL